MAAIRLRHTVPAAPACSDNFSEGKIGMTSVLIRLNLAAWGSVLDVGLAFLLPLSCALGAAGPVHLQTLLSAEGLVLEQVCKRKSYIMTGLADKKLTHT